MVHKNLSQFCTELTGITQDMVSGKPNIIETLKLFDQWLKKSGDLKVTKDDEPVNFIFVTCGDWDLLKMLPSQCKYFNIAYPNYFRKWINLKKAFCELTNNFPRGMTTMLEQFNLSLDGRHHSGIDDTKNIAKIVKEMGQLGYVFKPTFRK